MEASALAAQNKTRSSNSKKPSPKTPPAAPCKHTKKVSESATAVEIIKLRMFPQVEEALSPITVENNQIQSNIETVARRWSFPPSLMKMRRKLMSKSSQRCLGHLIRVSITLWGIALLLKIIVYRNNNLPEVSITLTISDRAGGSSSSESTIIEESNPLQGERLLQTRKLSPALHLTMKMATVRKRSLLLRNLSVASLAWRWRK